MSTQVQLSEKNLGKPTAAPLPQRGAPKELERSIGAKDIEKALINVLKAGIYYNKPKDGKFMISYKERVEKLRQAEDPNEYSIELARKIFPNESAYNQVIDDYKSWYGRNPEILNAIMELYKLYYELAKDSFITKEQLDKDVEDFLAL